MRRYSLLTIIAISVTALSVLPSVGNLLAQDDAAKKDEKKKIPTVEAETKPIFVYESFDGVFESNKVVEIKTNFKTWTDLKIKTVVEEGTAVSSRQDLVNFDTESIDKAVAEAEFATKTAEFALATAKLSKEEAKATFDLDMAIAEQAWSNAKEDYEYYRNVQLPQSLDDIKYSEKSAGYFLEYAKDEYDQLEQMYTEDELTEESEEIVLKRARRSVESSQRSKDRTMTRIKHQREVDIPRGETQKAQELERQNMSYQRSKITLPINKQKTEIALAQAEFAYKNKQEHLKELSYDQERMTITSPADGILYYGRSVRGKWVGATGSAARRLEPNKKVTANSVIMTIVDINNMVIRANLDESKLSSLSAGLTGKAMVKSATNLRVPVTIKSLSNIPLDDGKFDCQIMVGELPGEAKVMPGMGCKLSFLVRSNAQAVVVPKASVFTDDGGVTHYVYVVNNDTAERKEVTVGHTSGTDTEILEGLEAGDTIAKAKP